MYGIEPGTFRRDLIKHGKPLRMPIHTHANYSAFEAVDNGNGTWGIEVTGWRRPISLATIDPAKGQVMIWEAIPDGRLTGVSVLQQAFAELTGIIVSRNQNRYPFAACTANGLPAFEGMLFDSEGHAITTRDTVRIARSRGHAKRNRYHEIKGILQAAVALLPQGYRPE